jgi:hypothetical protein
MEFELTPSAYSYHTPKEVVFEPPKCEDIVKHLKDAVKKNYRGVHVNKEWLQVYELSTTYGIGDVVLNKPLPGNAIYALRHLNPNVKWMATAGGVPNDRYGLWAKYKDKFIVGDPTDVDDLVAMERKVYDVFELGADYISLGKDSGMDLWGNIIFGLRVIRRSGTMIIKIPHTLYGPELHVIKSLAVYSKKVRITVILGDLFLVVEAPELGPKMMRKMQESLHAQKKDQFIMRYSVGEVIQPIMTARDLVKKYKYDFLEAEAWLVKTGITPRK